MVATTNAIAKIAAVVAGLALVGMSFAVAAPAAHADTSSVQAQIQALLAQVAQLQAQLGTTGSANVTFTRDLTIGSTGADVTALQNWLISKGYSIPAGATGYFGAQTQAAVSAWQSAAGISPTAGYFGPKSRAAVNAMGGTTGTTGTTGTGGLTGGEGSINNFKSVGPTTTSLNSADSDQVMGFEFMAQGSDLAVDRVDFDVVGNGTGTTRPWAVFQTATLMNGSTVIASVDASNMSNWSQDGTVSSIQQYRVRFQGLHDIVKMGSTVDYYLKLSTQGTISSSNAGGTYTVTFPNQGLRATDAQNIQQYTSSTLTSTVSVSASTAGSAVISLASDNPQTSTVQGNSSNSTSGITVLSFNLQAKDADQMLYSLPVQIATTTSTYSNQVRTLKLYQGSTLLSTQTPSASTLAQSNATTTFNNLNVSLPAGSTTNFKVVAEINSITGSFTEGSSITATVPSYGFDLVVGNNSVTPTGGATGNGITFRSLGLGVDPTPTTSAVVTNNGGNVTAQTGTFTFTFNATAFGQDVYIASTTGAFTATVYDYSNSNTATGSSASANPTEAFSLTSNADHSTHGDYVIHSGQTKQITVQATVGTGNAHFYYVILSALKWGTSEAAGSTANSVTLPTSYQTGQAKVNS